MNIATADMQKIIGRQRQFFDSGRTRGVDFRIAQLKKLQAAIKTHEEELLKALKKDLGKSGFEAYGSEVGTIYEELRHTMKQLPKWAKPISVGTPMLFQPSSSKLYPEPRGVALIIGPWNYPVQLMLAPLIAAIAAGNCTVLKPSELAPATALAITALIEKTFSPEFCAVIPGGVPETTALLAQRFDHIFFTGSVPVGRIVMRAAAEHLTPVTLELGGKSPCIVDTDTDIAVTARRIVWGKFYNTGQTCIAPDYLLVPKSIKNELLKAMKAEITSFFGVDPAKSPDYGRIINERHFDRLAALLEGAQVAVGGELDRSSLYMAPTIVDNAKLGDKIMEDEIFGPLLPVLEYETLDQAIDVVKQRSHPLACYVFTNRAAVEERIIRDIPFGGGCVNNTLVHFANANLPFGGCGNSGVGAYHGKVGFDAFSHHKSIVKSSFKMDVKLRYPPYGTRLGLLKKIMR